MHNKKENPFINLLANIVIPVVVLNKTHIFPGEHKALFALGVALLFPLSYGLWDLIKHSKTNYFSILGLANTLITGLFAVFQLHGFWFAIKEAAMPAILGLFVYISAKKGKPFFKTVLVMSVLLKMNLIEEKASQKNKLPEIHNAFLKANNFFAISFVLSAVLNFILALYIFSPIPADSLPEDKSIILNGQISQMTWMGFLVIGVPMMFFLLATGYQLFKDLTKHTGLSLDEILNQPQ